MAKIPVENLIRHWETDLRESGYLMSPSTRILVQATVEQLKALQQLYLDLKKSNKAIEEKAKERGCK